MGIAEELDAQKRQFISLREALEKLAQSENCTIQQAAQWLCQRLAESQDRPQWKTYTAPDGVRSCITKKNPDSLLRHVAHTGGYLPDRSDDDIPF